MKAIDRIVEEIEKRKMKPAYVERDLSLSNGYIMAMFKKKGSLTEENILKFSEYFNLSLEYLLKGTDEIENILKEPEPNYSKLDFKDKYIQTLEELAECRKQLIELQGNFPATGPIGVTKPIAKTGS